VQLRRWDATRDAVAGEPFAGVHTPGPVTLVPPPFTDAPAAATRQEEAPMTLHFGLQIPRFSVAGGPAALREQLPAIARTAEDVGFTSLWVMDHMLQIPQMGREWEDMLDSWTTLAFLAGATERIRLGPLVTGITYRNIAHLGKIAATLDVLSGGRVVCGLGAAWFGREHELYGWPFPPLAQRYAALEDALELLPLLWGPGAPRYEGRTITVPEAVCYPRPVQDLVPLLVGGSGERRTLRLVAQHADACNLFGDAPTVAHKVEVLRRHCAELGRDPEQIKVTHLSTALVGEDDGATARQVEELRPRSVTPEAFAERVNAASVVDHVGRFRQLAEAGVQTAIVSLADLDGPAAVERFRPVVAAFPQPSQAW
jgi:F420-dependent oxidoreductase-like protein